MTDMLNTANAFHEVPIHGNQNDITKNSNQQCSTHVSLDYTHVDNPEPSSNVWLATEHYSWRENVDRNENEISGYGCLQAMKHKLSIVIEKDESELDNDETRTQNNTNALPPLKEEDNSAKTLRSEGSSGDAPVEAQTNVKCQPSNEQVRSPASANLTSFDEIHIMNTVHPCGGSPDKIPSTPPSDFQYYDRVPRKWDEMEVLPNSDSTARLAEIISTCNDDAEVTTDLFEPAPKAEELPPRCNTSASKQRRHERPVSDIGPEQKKMHENQKVRETVNYVSSLFPTPRFCPEHLELLDSPDKAIMADEFVLVVTPDAEPEEAKQIGTNSQEQSRRVVQIKADAKTAPEQLPATFDVAEKSTTTGNTCVATPTISVSRGEENRDAKPLNCMIDSPGSELMHSALSNFPDEFGSCETLEELETDLVEVELKPLAPRERKISASCSNLQEITERPEISLSENTTDKSVERSTEKPMEQPVQKSANDGMVSGPQTGKHDSSETEPSLDIRSTPIVDILKCPPIIENQLQSDIVTVTSATASASVTPNFDRKSPSEPQSPRALERRAAGLEKLAAAQRAAACLANVRTAAANAGRSTRHSSFSNATARESVRKWQSKARSTRQYFFNKWKDLMKAVSLTKRNDLSILPHLTAALMHPEQYCNNNKRSMLDSSYVD